VVARGVDIFVVTSDGDKALKISAMVRGNDKRLGLLDDPSVLEPIKVTMIDISQVSAKGATSHFKAGTSPAILAFINTLQTSGVDLLDSHPQGLLANSVALVQSGMNIVLKPLE
jgi:esterase/lipase superfamily enzyme